MSTLAIEVNPLAENIEFTESELIVLLADGRKISTPLAWFPQVGTSNK